MLARSARILNFRGLMGGLMAMALLAVGAAVTVASAADEVAAPKVGDMAPDIKLPDQAGKTQSLADYRGKWVVLYFYPKDQTPGCTTQACEFRDNIFAVRKAGIQILGISVDDVASHKEFAEKHGLPFPLLADPTKETAKRYGVLTSMGPIQIARRDTFIIDPAGKIVRHFEKVNPTGHAQLVLDEVEKLKAAKG
jgi:thioredoxin-dependent peroxiredoxin